MTLFEYIKNEATVEQIAQIFDHLENDNGAYTRRNVKALWYVLENPDTYELNDDYSNAYKLALKKLQEEI